MNGCNLTASITAIANTLACRLTENELTLLGSVLTQLGDTLLTLATHRSIKRSRTIGSRLEPLCFSSVRIVLDSDT